MYLKKIRKDIAEFIQRRDDGVPARPEDIIITEGATEGITASTTHVWSVVVMHCLVLWCKWRVIIWQSKHWKGNSSFLKIFPRRRTCWNSPTNRATASGPEFWHPFHSTRCTRRQLRNTQWNRWAQHTNPSENNQQIWKVFVFSQYTVHPWRSVTSWMKSTTGRWTLKIWDGLLTRPESTVIPP